MTIQHLPIYGEMIYYITKYHIKYPLNIHNREESTSKKGQTEVTQLILMQSVLGGYCMRLKRPVNTQRQTRVQTLNVNLRPYEGAKGDEVASAV